MKIATKDLAPVLGAFARIKLLPLIGVCLVALVLLKSANIWIGFTPAGAAEPAQVETPTKVVSPQDTGPAVIRSSEPERRIYEQLATRRAALDARGAELDTREALLMAAEANLEKQLGDFARAKAELETLAATQDAQADNELESIVSTYEKMKSRDAAKIFEVLEDEILVPVAAGMRTAALAGVLAEMTPEKARALTKNLAERSKTQKSVTPVGAQ